MNREPGITIRGRRIATGQPTYVIAELSANHGGSLSNTLDLVHAAKESGADAVKVQTYTPDTITIKSDLPSFRITGTTLWDGRTLYDLYAEAFMPWDWQPKLKEIANNLGLDFFSTAFDPSSIEFLEAMDVPAHKVASFEIVDIPLIRRIAATGKPLLLSTGMATLGTIEEAVSAARSAGASEIALLKCTSAYPASPSEMHLRTIPHMSAGFALPVGLSDHSMGVSVPVAAVALGACIIEKHFTLSRAAKGPDSAFSLEPNEFRAMVEAIRTAEQACGTVHYGPGEGEAASSRFRRSLFIVREVKTGEEFTPANIRSIRPGLGLHPRHLDDFLGRRARHDIPAGTPAGWNQLQDK